jgi:hypothetical protein
MYPRRMSFLLVYDPPRGEVMTTEAALAPDTNVSDVCGCGQDLDCCEREHCPRCGCEIHRVA